MNTEDPKYKLVVISDTHHDVGRLERLLPIINAADYLVYCGDGLRDLLYVRGRITVPIVAVRGNNDLYSFPDGVFTDMASVSFGRTKALVTHGHNFGVRHDLTRLLGIAITKGCKLVFFGHTHAYYDRIEKGVHLINPGALCNGSYAIVVGDGTDFISIREWIQ